MSQGVLLRGAAVAFGMAAFVSFTAPYARADADVPMPPQRDAPVSVTAPAPSPIPASAAGADALRTVPQNNMASSADTPSLAEPAPTPGWAESHQALDASASSPSVVASAPSERQASGVTRRSASPRYYRTSANPVAHAARNVVGGVADVGAVVAYPVYCFPNYGRCPVKVPYRF